MNKLEQVDVNTALLDYCDRLEKKIQEQAKSIDYSSKRLDEYIDILEAMAEKISQ